MDDTSPLAIPLEELISALRAHAEAMSNRAEPPEAMTAINALGAAAVAYTSAVFERSGWGNVFADLGDDEDDDDWDDEGDDVLDAGEGVERLSVTGRWDFLVRDPVALAAFTAQRLREVHQAGDEGIAEHTANANACLESLVSMDMGPYPGLEESGGGWSIDYVDRTLWEMSPDERDASPF